MGEKIGFLFYFFGPNQLFIWIGAAEARLDTVHAGFPSEDDLLATCLLGDIGSPGAEIAGILGTTLNVCCDLFCCMSARKLHRPVFVSYNVVDTDALLRQFIQKELSSFMEQHAAAFTVA